MDHETFERFFLEGHDRDDVVTERHIDEILECCLNTARAEDFELPDNTRDEIEEWADGWNARVGLDE